MRSWTIAALLAAALPALSWGPEGHALIARIAEGQLTPAAHARVAEILGPGVSMESIASWPDQIRRSRPETGPWHYIDIPISAPHLNMARDCPAGDCIIAKIGVMRAHLRDPATPAPERREALMFLIHFIGDMHQPLHCSDNKDKGGNDVHVVFYTRNSNLHSLWDSGLLGHMGNEAQLFPELSSESMKHRRKWSKGSVEDWAEQAHKIAVKTAYGKLPKASKGEPVEVAASYESKADPQIREQIEKGGARLARVLNETLQ